MACLTIQLSKYALTSTIIRLLDHLTEAELFTRKDLESLTNTLDRITDMVEHGKTEPFVDNMIMSRVRRCRTSLNNLKAKVEAIDPVLRPTIDQVVQILRQMAVVATRKVRKVVYPQWQSTLTILLL